ncbi:MAG: flagellar basal body-associated FliL family protein [Planctomycetota bacterium]|jgi:hypothetical protein
MRPDGLKWALAVIVAGGAGVAARALADPPADQAEAVAAAPAEETPIPSPQPLMLAVTLDRPLPQPVTVEASVTPGESFKKIDVVDACSYTIWGDLRRTEEGRYRLTINVRRWRSPTDQLVLSTTVELTADTMHLWRTPREGVIHTCRLTLTAPVSLQPADQEDSARTAEETSSDADPDQDAADDSTPSATQDQDEQEYEQLHREGPIEKPAKAGALHHASLWPPVAVQLSTGDNVSVCVHVIIVVEEKELGEFFATLRRHKIKLRQAIIDHLRSQSSSKVEGPANVKRLTDSVARIVKQVLYQGKPSPVRAVYFQKYLVRK